jgi:hypothetical protein
MLKKMILAAVPMMFLVSISVAEENFLADFDVSSIQDADISIEEAGFDVDFDDLANKAGGEDEAIEASFRHFGYGYRSYGYGYRGYGYGYRSHGYGYNCYRPYYHSYYRPYYSCYRPVYYHTYYPVYRNYWGCW